MKKILAILAMAISGSVYAASATVEYQDQTGVNGTANSSLYLLSVSENINKNFSAAVTTNFSAKDSNGAIGNSRLEGSVTGKTTIGLFSPYMRLGVGQKFTSTTNYSYYSVEPGVTAPLGNTGLTARLGYRYRTAFDSTANADTTNTWRLGMSYAVTKQDTVGIRYDQIRGDSNQNNVAFNYTRNF
jgi:opacity protein-like surface antigen